MLSKASSIKSVLHGRLSFGDDFLLDMKRMLVAKNISTGYIQAIGAVSELKLAFFNQTNKTYEEQRFYGEWEILNITGNISVKNGEQFIHAHGCFSNKDFNVIGGHLLDGCIVYACEYTLFEYDEKPFEREYDSETGLYLFGNKK